MLPKMSLDQLHNVEAALRFVGFDANAAECQQFINRYIGKLTVADADVAYMRAEMQKRDPGKAYYCKADRLLQNAVELMLTSEGREAAREAMRRLDKERLHELLGLIKTE